MQMLTDLPEETTFFFCLPGWGGGKALIQPPIYAEVMMVGFQYTPNFLSFQLQTNIDLMAWLGGDV